jgi:hypothetical protein
VKDTEKNDFTKLRLEREIVAESEGDGDKYSIPDRSDMGKGDSSSTEGRLEIIAEKQKKNRPILKHFKTIRKANSIICFVGAIVLFACILAWPYFSAKFTGLNHWFGNPVWTAIMVTALMSMLVSSVFYGYINRLRTFTMDWFFLAWSAIKSIAVIAVCIALILMCVHGIEDFDINNLVTMSDIVSGSSMG